MSWSKCMTCICLRSGFDLAKICDACMPHFHTYPKLYSKPLVVGYEKKAKYQMPWWGFIHIERSRESSEELTFSLQKHIKPPDRQLIKEWMIGDSVITIISCNRPRTWKSYTPHRVQGKGWIKMLTYLNCKRILCYRHGTYEIFSA
jgi:hypothetical protein